MPVRSPDLIKITCQKRHSLPGPPPGVDTSLRAAKWSYFSARLNTPTSQPNLAPIYGPVLANIRDSDASETDECTNIQLHV